MDIVSNNFAKEPSASWIDEINKPADQLIQFALGSYFLLGLVLAFFHQTWWVAFCGGTLWQLSYWGTKILLPQRSLHRYVASTALGGFTIQFVYQMPDLFEIYCVAFLSSALLVTYQQWKLQIPLLAVTLIHYSSSAYLPHPVLRENYITHSEATDLPALLIRLAFLGAIVGIGGANAHYVRKKTLQRVRLLIDYQQQATNTGLNIQFANEITKGNLNPAFELSQEDALSKALLDMRQSLMTANKREEQAKFKTVGLAEMGDILRSHHNVEELAAKLIAQLVKYLKANQGGLFIVYEEGDRQRLDLIACYAYERKKFLKKSVQIGEGLVGQAAQEKDTLYLTDVPSDYIHITSGLGKANPTSILIVPLVVNEKIEGVIELASFHPFQPFEIEFVQKLGESIASTIASVRINESTKRLLTDMQQQAEEMRAQEEEMRQHMEELAATQEEMQRKNTEMERVLATSEKQLEQIANNEKRIAAIVDGAMDAIIQTDRNGNIQRPNSAATAIFNYGAGELLGKHISDLLPQAEPSLLAQEAKIKMAANRKDSTGFIAEISFKSITSEEGLLYLFFVRDIDDIIRQEQEVQRKQGEVEQLLQQSRQNEKIMKVQEERLHDHMQAMMLAQETLKDQALELELVRKEEKARADALLEAQKMIVKKVMNQS